MTSFLFGVPDIPFHARTITPSAPLAQDQPEYNLFAGHRSLMGRFAATATSRSVSFDVGAGLTAPMQYAFLARADILVANGLNRFQLARSADDSAYTDEIDASSFGTLYGPRQHDWIHVVPTTSAYRYWKATLTSAVAQDFRFAKLYFGTFLDLGVDPDDYDIVTELPEKEQFITDSGATITARTYDEKYRLTLIYEGVADAAIKSFQDRIMALQASDRTIVAYAATQGEVLDFKTCIHCQVLSFETYKPSTRPDWNDCRIELVEMIG